MSTLEERIRYLEDRDRKLTEVVVSLTNYVADNRACLNEITHWMEKITSQHTAVVDWAGEVQKTKNTLRDIASYRSNN